MFQSGILTGKEFDAKYVHDDRRFELVSYDFEGMTYPNSTWSPAVGDTYSVYGIMLPASYIRDDTTQTGASWDMFREAARYLYEHENDPFSFVGELDGIWSASDWLNIGGKIVLGGYISFTDAQFQTDPILIRIVGLKDFVRRPHSPVLELSNKSVAGSTVASELRKISSDEVISDARYGSAVQYFKRGWRDAMETLTIMQNSMLAGFSGAINPITIQSMQALFGSEQLQFRFIDFIPTSDDDPRPNTVDYQVTYNATDRTLNAPSAYIQHTTLGIDYMSPEHGNTEYKYWALPAFQSPPLEDSKYYYLYAKCSRTSQAGTFYLSETGIAMDSDPDYYYFWVGFLNSVYDMDGTRSNFVMLANMFTEILPGMITTRYLRSPNGNLVIDLLTGTITGEVHITAGSDGFENVPDFSNIQDYIDNVLPQQIDELQRQIDDNIESWFYHYDPDNSTYPTSDWIANDAQEMHIDDTFTNLDSGQSWRYTKDSNNVYSWTLMADTAASAALVLAGQAKDTADGKRRTFVGTSFTSDSYPTQARPFPPYDVGDLWYRGTAYAVMVCNTARVSGTGSAGDWSKQDMYTDDTLAASVQSSLNVFKNSIEGTVTELQSTVNGIVTWQSGVLLTSEAATLYARKDNIISVINASAEGISISGAKVAIQAGQVTFSMLNSSTQTTINNKADASTVSALDTSLSYWKNKNASSTSLISLAMLDSTIISGGYIKTSLIDVNNLVVNETLKIGDFVAHSGWLYASNTYGLTQLATGLSLGLMIHRIDYSLPDNTKVAYVDIRAGNTAAAIRSAEMGIMHPSSDASWYNRTYICLSHLPAASHLSGFAAVSNSTGTSKYAVGWDAKTGMLFWYGSALSV
jgi:hypothetical protein